MSNYPEESSLNNLYKKVRKFPASILPHLPSHPNVDLLLSPSRNRGRARGAPVMGKGMGVPEISKACTLMQEAAFDSKKPT